ncbi:MAG: M48 family metallopeptidase [Acidovorax sp.]|nr:M48 family metallopeptidase [Acidovorax sp.]
MRPKCAASTLTPIRQHRRPRQTPPPPTRPRPDMATPPQPTAQAVALLQGQQVPYRLQRSARRTLGLLIDAQGLQVRAPLRTPQQAIDALLHDKAAWVLRKLAHVQTQEQQREQGRLQWHDGATLPYLGQPLRLALQPGPRATAQLGHDAQGAHLQLALPDPATATATAIRAATLAWFGRQARHDFSQRLTHFAPLLGVQWRSLRLSSARTRWGSARSDGAIALNWRLLHYAPPVIDYVVVHELAHLRHMNHSAQFWATVAQVLPDYALRRQQLHAQPVPLWQ